MSIAKKLMIKNVRQFKKTFHICVLRLGMSVVGYKRIGNFGIQRSKNIIYFK